MCACKRSIEKKIHQPTESNNDLFKIIKGYDSVRPVQAATKNSMNVLKVRASSDDTCKFKHNKASVSNIYSTYTTSITFSLAIVRDVNLLVYSFTRSLLPHHICRLSAANQITHSSEIQLVDCHFPVKWIRYILKSYSRHVCYLCVCVSVCKWRGRGKREIIW